MKQYTYQSNYIGFDNAKLKKRFKIKTGKNKTTTFLVYSTKEFKAYSLKCKKAHQDITIVGKTKLKVLEKNSNEKSLATKKCDAVLSKNSSEYFEIRNKYSLVRTAGYIPVGNNEFVEIVKFNPIWLLFLLIILSSICTLSYAIQSSVTESNRENPYVQSIDVPEASTTDPTSTRYRMNVTMLINKQEDGYVISNLNFENWNEGKDLRLKIKLHPEDKDYIYDSEMIGYGKKIDADYLDKPITEPGTYKTIAECYAYNLEGEKLSQTNFEITLIVN